jgi:hypothetical protein
VTAKRKSDFFLFPVDVSTSCRYCFRIHAGLASQRSESIVWLPHALRRLIGIETFGGEFAVLDVCFAGMAPHVQVHGTATKGGDDMDVNGDSIYLYEPFPNFRHSPQGFLYQTTQPLRVLG